MCLVFLQDAPVARMTAVQAVSAYAAFEDGCAVQHAVRTIVVKFQIRLHALRIRSETMMQILPQLKPINEMLRSALSSAHSDQESANLPRSPQSF